MKLMITTRSKYERIKNGKTAEKADTTRVGTPARNNNRNDFSMGAWTFKTTSKTVP